MEKRCDLINSPRHTNQYSIITPIEPASIKKTSITPRCNILFSHNTPRNVLIVTQENNNIKIEFIS